MRMRGVQQNEKQQDTSSLPLFIYIDMPLELNSAFPQPDHPFVASLIQSFMALFSCFMSLPSSSFYFSSPAKRNTDNDYFLDMIWSSSLCSLSFIFESNDGQYHKEKRIPSPEILLLHIVFLFSFLHRVTYSIFVFIVNFFMQIRETEDKQKIDNACWSI